MLAESRFSTAVQICADESGFSGWIPLNLSNQWTEQSARHAQNHPVNLQTWSRTTTSVSWRLSGTKPSDPLRTDVVRLEDDPFRHQKVHAVSSGVSSLGYWPSCTRRSWHSEGRSQTVPKESSLSGDAVRVWSSWAKETKGLGATVAAVNPGAPALSSFVCRWLCLNISKLRGRPNGGAEIWVFPAVPGIHLATPGTPNSTDGPGSWTSIL